MNNWAQRLRRHSLLTLTNADAVVTAIALSVLLYRWAKTVTPKVIQSSVTAPDKGLFSTKSYWYFLFLQENICCRCSLEDDVFKNFSNFFSVYYPKNARKHNWMKQIILGFKNKHLDVGLQKGSSMFTMCIRTERLRKECRPRSDVKEWGIWSGSTVCYSSIHD